MEPEFPIHIGTWHSHDPLTISFRGIGSHFREFINSLVEQFNEPKFGYNGELWDEDDDPEWESQFNQ